MNFNKQVRAPRLKIWN